MTGEQPGIEQLVDEWIRSAAAFLRDHPAGCVIAPDALEKLITTREKMLAPIEARREELAARRELAARLVEVEQELARRVEEDLERRRADLDDMGRMRASLEAYRGSRDDQRNLGRRSRYFDSRS